MKPRVIARNLGIPKDQVADVKKAVKRLVRLGQIQYAANHLVLPILVAEHAGAQAAAEDVALDKRILEKLALRLPRLEKIRRRQIQSPANRAGKIAARPRGGHVQPHGERIRVRQIGRHWQDASATDARAGREGTRRHLHPGEIRRRRLDRRYRGRASFQTPPRRAGAARRNRRNSRTADERVRGHVFRVARGGLRAGRWHAVRQADLGRRSRREKRPARR